MHADGKAEGRWQTFGAIIPAAAAVGRAPDTIVVLLVEDVARTRRTNYVVNAVPDFTIAWRGGMLGVAAGFGI